MRISPNEIFTISHKRRLPESNWASSARDALASSKNALILSLMVASFPVIAQSTDGDLGITSSGKLEIGLQVLDSVQVSALDAIDFGTYGGSDSGGLNLGDAFCVYVNGGDQYTITPTSANSTFRLKGTTFGDEIEYAIRVNGASTGAESAPQIPYSTASSPFLGSQQLDCNANNNASIDLSIAEQAMRDASTDTYSDTIILLVNPI